jgi:hypothetical protein
VLSVALLQQLAHGCATPNRKAWRGRLSRKRSCKPGVLPVVWVKDADVMATILPGLQLPFYLSMLVCMLMAAVQLLRKLTVN